MVNYRVIFGLLFVVLLLGLIFQTLLGTAKNAQIEEAEELSDALKEYFKMAGERCTSRKGDFKKQTNCLYNIMDELEIVANVEEDEFKNANPSKNQTGHVVLINEGRNSMESTKFVLKLNHNIVDRGCTLQGAIDTGFTCRLEFIPFCDSGDVLEVEYEEKQVYLKAC